MLLYQEMAQESVQGKFHLNKMIMNREIEFRGLRKISMIEPSYFDAFVHIKQKQG